MPVVGQQQITCVYPLSGVYAPLQRILFYILLTFGVIGRRHRWLVAGALASAMTYCGAAAIHSIFLIARSRSSVVDLDVYGVFATTSTGIMLVTPLLAWSTTLQSVEQDLRAIVVLWTLLVLQGAVLSLATIYTRGDTPGPTCLAEASLGDVPDTAATLRNATADCIYVCYPETRPLARSPADVQVWENHLDTPFRITVAFLITAAGSLPSWIMTWYQFIRVGHVNLLSLQPVLGKIDFAWMGGWVFLRRLGRDRQTSSSYGSSVAVGDDHVRGAESTSPMLSDTLWAVLRYYSILSSFGVFVVNLVLNEVRFRSLPTDEMPFEVGQWSPWVSVGLVLVAQGVSRLFKRGNTEKCRDGEDEELRLFDRDKGMGSGCESEKGGCRRRNSL
ncbi:uncharacterized protein BDV14DRAFT_184526 [Aspergillus stella-maris]|uniref:uncharacterized protein n=1 Tax=Aspergillus stella-maris TaxID=1810926 RepID=UPI003CCD1C09